MGKLQNPQDWLPVGQRVNTGDLGPVSMGERHQYGEIVQHLANGQVVVKFDDYFATWDFSAREACKFSRCH